MLYSLIITIHVIACFVLIAVILLQAGRGGGLSEAFGGATQSLFGTKANVVLTRATEISAVVFLITCILLGIMTSRRGKSLVELQRRGIPLTQPLPLAGPEEALPGPLEHNQERVPLDETLDETKETLPNAEPEEAPKK